MITERTQTKAIEQAARKLCRYLVKRAGIRSDMQDTARSLLALLEHRDSKPAFATKEQPRG